MSLLYSIVATLLWPFAALVVLVHPRLRAHAGERLGRVVPEVEPGAVWIHAASLGEGRVAEALVAALRAADPDVEILRTCTSDVARAQRIGADQTTCLPIDVPFGMRAFLDRTRPRCLLLVESELWPGLLLACRARRIPVAVVGARVGPGLRRMRRLFPGLLAGVRWLPRDAEAARIVGGEPVGDLKAAAPIPSAAIAWSRDAVVAGSTHPGEEDALIDGVAALSPRPLLVLAPRDPRRFDVVGARLDARGVRWVRRTALAGPVPPEADVVLLDTVGEVAGLYARARAAFVGGTFVAEVGGHSPAEALRAGCPVVHGPHTASAGEAWSAAPTYRAASPAELPDALARALAAPRVVVVEDDAAGRAVEALAALLAAPAPPERPLRPWLWPLVPAWRAGVALGRRPGAKAPVPVVSVNGIAAGGSGKTPVAAWIAARLGDRAPVVVARGYRRRRGGDVRLTGEASDLGDELAMLARRGLRVASAPDRLAGVVAAHRAGAGLAVLDDGWMAGGVRADLEVVTVDARWPTGGGPIPVGTGRVPLGWLRRADVVWVNHGPLPAELKPHLRADAIVVEARYRPAYWLRRGERVALDALPRRGVLAFAGIARPEGFFRALRRLGVLLDRTWVFPDHHVFVWSDLQSIEAWLDDHVVVTTEKDAARLPADSAVFALVMEPEIVRGADELVARLGRL
ncbi:MAG: tetraacyldisaccharide 4'-kinase [Myxococcota bacterium]